MESWDCRFSRFLSDVLLLSACCVFLVSTLNPFLTVPYHFSRWGNMPVICRFTVTYSSYKATVGNGFRTEAFFGDYWFSHIESEIGFLGVSWVLIAMFLLQILTLVSGFVSLLKIHKARIIPFILSLSVILLMVYVFVQGQKRTLYLAGYERGYWLVYPSMFLFLLASILSLATNRNN